MEVSLHPILGWFSVWEEWHSTIKFVLHSPHLFQFYAAFFGGMSLTFKIGKLTVDKTNWRK